MISSEGFQLIVYAFRMATKWGGIPYQWDRTKLKLVITKQSLFKWAISALATFSFGLFITIKTVYVLKYKEYYQATSFTLYRGIIIAMIMGIFSIIHFTMMFMLNSWANWINFYVQEMTKLKSMLHFIFVASSFSVFELMIKIVGK